MAERVYAAKCSGCGAVTVTIDGEDYSMPHSWYRKRFPYNRLQKQHMGCCNHCVNHWGIDLCECGSGRKYQKCCGRPMQTLGQKQERVLWATP